MSGLPVNFPSERERLRRLVEADRGLSFRERVQEIDGLLAAIDRFRVSDEVRATRLRMALAEHTKKQRCLSEFLREQLAAQSQHR